MEVSAAHHPKEDSAVVLPEVALVADQVAASVEMDLEEKMAVVDSAAVVVE